MKEGLLESFKEEFAFFRETPDYKTRVEQANVLPLFQNIILDTLQDDELTNKKLTGFIQMFKFGCKPETFRDYLNINIPIPERRDPLLESFKKLGQTGYTAAGLASINNLDFTQLKQVKDFLLKIIGSKDLEEAIKSCEEFDALDIPQIKKGIYSPWLFYIAPDKFPIVNEQHTIFRKRMGIPDDYPSCIRDYTILKNLVGESDFSNIDNFAYQLAQSRSGYNINYFLKRLHERFPRIWRCATSDKWDAFRNKSILSFNYLRPGVDYKQIKITGEGKTNIENWVNKLKKGDLIVVMDKYKYFGICIAETAYEFGTLDLEVAGKVMPCIKVNFLHSLENPIDHNMEISPTNPATFYKLNGLGFKEKDTLEFFEREFPDVISQLNKMLKINSTPDLYRNIDNKLSLNQILYGPPGTGKTYCTIEKALEITGHSATTREEQKEAFAKLQQEGRVFFSTFHQNMAYEDFIEGIKPIEPKDDDTFLKYEIRDGLFMRACVEATYNFLHSNLGYKTKKRTYNEKREVVREFWNKREYLDPKNPDDSEPFVFIIDEINRGNVAQVFGELITLIEDDKRLGRKEVLYADLPYSRNAFAVPPNLHIIGTMNTADRSVEALDTALRRRFAFEAKVPLKSGLKPTEEGIELQEILNKMNERLIVLKDHDHTVGHAFFWEVNNLKQLQDVFGKQVLPLLQEFFYNDYEKLGLVLGDAFFKKQENIAEKTFANFPRGADLANQYENAVVYELKAADELSAEDFKSLYF